MLPIVTREQKKMKMKRVMFARALVLSLGLSAAAASAKPAEKQAPAGGTKAVGTEGNENARRSTPW
jgi:uncharacterized membrane protein